MEFVEGAVEGEDGDGEEDFAPVAPAQGPAEGAVEREGAGGEGDEVGGLVPEAGEIDLLDLCAALGGKPEDGASPEDEPGPGAEAKAERDAAGGRDGRSGSGHAERF